MFVGGLSDPPITNGSCNYTRSTHGSPSPSQNTGICGLFYAHFSLGLGG